MLHLRLGGDDAGVNIIQQVLVWYHGKEPPWPRASEIQSGRRAGGAGLP